jgi:hypothetical protein
MLRILILINIYSVFVCAQGHIPEKMKTKNSDLRSKSRLFEIKSLKDKKKSFLLDVVNNQHILTYEDGEKTQRISTEDSEKIDKKFVSEFIHLKYAMNRVSKKMCFKAYELNMRGETQFICKDEINKIEKLNQLISELNNLINK